MQIVKALKTTLSNTIENTICIVFGFAVLSWKPFSKPQLFLHECQKQDNFTVSTQFECQKRLNEEIKHHLDQNARAAVYIGP